MYGQKRLTEVYNSSKEIIFDDSSKIVIMSDCHRGDGSYSDNFSKNESIYFAALSHYFKLGYIYIELGDGDELWENNNIKNIIDAHLDVFCILSKFYKANRLYFIFGNHDMIKKERKYAKRLSRHLNHSKEEYINLFEDLDIHEGLILKHKYSKDKMFLVHGHQVSFLDYKLWKIRRFLVRHIWRPLELMGINDPTSPSRNYEKKEIIARRLSKWASLNKTVLIAGHNHQPHLPQIGEIPYFNDGSCVHPMGITALEIEDGLITLVKWKIKSKENGILFAGREILSGPRKLKDYFKSI